MNHCKQCGALTTHAQTLTGRVLELDATETIHGKRYAVEHRTGRPSIASEVVSVAGHSIHGCKAARPSDVSQLKLGEVK